jgi:hypothetical protein
MVGVIHTMVTAMVGDTQVMDGDTQVMVGDTPVMDGDTQDTVGDTQVTVGDTRVTVGAITHLIIQDIMKGPLTGNDMQITAVV